MSAHMEWREAVGIERVRLSSGHGLWGFLLAHRRWLPDWLLRLYHVFQPLRCRLGYHDWYNTAAGACSACRCGADEPYPRTILWWSRDPQKRRLASELEETEYRLQVVSETLSDVLEYAARDGAAGTSPA